MKNKSEQKPNKYNKWLWLAFALVTVLAFGLMHAFHLVGPMKALAWLVWLVVSLLILVFTEKGQFVFDFVKESKLELKKVVWPSRQETVQTTSIVMVMVAVTGFVLWGVDSMMMWVIGKITHLG